MQCLHAQELYSDYVSGTIENALAVSLENHLDICSECRDEVEGLRHVWAVLDHAALVDAPMFLHENIMSRIDAAAASVEEEAAAKRALWDWRSLFKPRSLAYAAAAVTLLFASVEVVQTQRASLGPISSLIHILRPAPAASTGLETLRADWTAGTEGSGTVALHMKAESDAATYRAQVIGYSAKAEGTLETNKDTVISIPLGTAPTTDTLKVSVLVTLPDGTTNQRTLSVPVH
nr:Putative zinc-finger [uncultured bacterium]